MSGDDGLFGPDLSDASREDDDVVEVVRHQCSAMDWARRRSRQPMWGLVLDADSIVNLNGYWLLYNGEYSGPIRFCPWCGAELTELRGDA